MAGLQFSKCYLVDQIIPEAYIIQYGYMISKISLAVIYFAILIIFFPGLSNYFLQDDFFNMYRGWIGAFNPTPYLAFRPIPYEIFGSFVVYVLGMNPVLTHLFLLFAHFLNVFLLWKLIGKFTKNIWVQFFTSFLYGVSSIHFGVLFWLTASYLLFGTTILLIFLYVLISHKSNPRKGKTTILIFLYLVMLLTNETFSVFPLFLFFVSIYEKSVKRLLIPLALLSGISIAFRFISKAYSAGSDYAIGTTYEIVRTVWWYILRGINITEGIRTMDKLQSQLVFLYLTVIAVCTGLALFIFLKQKRKPDRKILILGILWFVFFASVYFVLPRHETAYYLNTALIGFAGVITYIWFPVLNQKQTKYKILISFFLTVWGLLSYLNVRFVQQTSWIVWRGEIARKYIQLVKQNYPTLPKSATVVFQKTAVSHKEISLALYNEYALKLIYKDKTLKVIYDEEHILKPNEYGVSESDS